MIVQKDFLNKLKDFGLNTYEAKIWTALLSRGVSTAGELSDIANVPRSRSYDVLESLEKKGFIIMKVGKPIHYIAVPPEEVLERVKKKISKEADSQMKTLEDLRKSDILEDLNSLHTQGVDLVEPNEISGSIKGRSNLYDHLEMMIKGAESSVILTTTAQGLIRKEEILKPILEKAKKRGVSIKIAAPLTHKEAENVAKSLKDVALVKELNINARFCIVDGKELMFMLLEDSQVHSSYDIGVWVNTDFFASALKDLFDIAWKSTKEVKIKK